MFMTVSRGIRPRHQPEVKSQILEMQAGGVKRCDIAEKLGVKESYVHKVIRNAGTTLSKEQRRANIADGRKATTAVYPEGTTDRILELKSQGLSRLQIAEKVGVDINKVISDLQRFRDRWDALTAEQRSNAHRKYPVETMERALEMRRRGDRIAEISGALDVDWHIVRYWCEQAGVLLTPEQRGQNRRRYSDVIETQIAELRATGMTVSDIVDQMFVSRAFVKSVCSERNIRVPMSVAIANAQKGKHKYYLGVRDRFFATVAEKGGKILSEYIDFATEVSIRCRAGHTFSMQPGRIEHSYNWCPRCSGWGPSGPQLEIAKLLKSIVGEHNVLVSDRTAIAPRELDIYIPSMNIAVEYNGIFWHSDRFSHRTRHLEKLEMCESAGIRLITIFESEWIARPDTVKRYLASILGAGDKLYARKLRLEKVPASQTRSFFEANHVQGAGSGGGECYGLYNGENLVAAAEFKLVAPRRDKDSVKEWNLTRYCLGGVGVVGGFDRLFSAFVNEFAPTSVVTFSDRRWSRGGVYERAGFTIDTVLPPNYWYFRRGSQGPLFHKAGFQKKAIARRYGLLEGETESQAMERLGFLRIWDCGVVKWVWTPKP